MKKKLLIFHRTIAPYRIDFFNSLYEEFDTRVCLMYRNLKSQKFDYDKIERQFIFSPFYLKERKLFGHTFYSGYWKYLKECNPDIVLVSEFDLGTLFVLLYKWLAGKHFKVVSICDDSYNMVAESNDFSWTHRLARKLLTPLLDDLILVEPRVVEWYKRHYGKGLWFPIIKKDDGARIMYERLLPKSLDTARKWGVVGLHVFLFVGRLVALKNVETAIRAFSKLDQLANVFVVVGDGPERERLERLADELKANVIFTGRLEGDSLNQWYNVSNCLVLPSYLEPFGAVTNEALLAGCRCLVSKKAGSSCLVEEGVNGYTFDPMNVEELKNKMEMLQFRLEGSNANLRANMMLSTYDNLMENLISHLYRLQG